LEKLKLPDIEKKYAESLKRFLAQAPEEDRLARDSVAKYSDKIPGFRVGNYEL